MSLADFGVWASVALAAGVPFIITLWVTLAGRAGVGVAVLVLLAACLATVVYGLAVPLWFDPMGALLLGQLGLTPAMAGGLAGLALGWVLRRRRHNRLRNRRRNRDRNPMAK